jgi:polar amino acid transport system substrate-binding protein
MQQCRFRAICLTVAALAFLFAANRASPSLAGESPLTLFVIDRPPYYTLQEGKPPGGFLLGMVLDIFKAAGISIEIREMPHSRVLATFEARDIRACSVGWILTPQREAYAWFSLPFYTNLPIGVVVRQEKATSLGPSPLLEDLLTADLAWGLRQEFSHGQQLDAAFRAHPKLRIGQFSDLRTILRLIAKGRLDATLLSAEEFSAQLAAEPELADSLRLLPIADGPPGFTRRIMCDRSLDPALLARIDAAITAYMQTEQYRSQVLRACPGQPLAPR